MDEVREALVAGGCMVREEDETVVLNHASSLEGATFLLNSEKLSTRTSVDGVYVSTSVAIISLRGDWQVVVPVRVRVRDLEVSADERGNADPEIRRVDFRLPVDRTGVYEPLGVGREPFL